jgi:hypothetical protein
MSFWTIIKTLPWADIFKLVFSIISDYREASEKRRKEITALLKRFNENKEKNEKDITDLFDDINRLRRM